MKRFAALIEELDATNKTNQRVEALTEYFRSAPERDAVWTLFLFLGRRLPRPVSSRELRDTIGAVTNYPSWLVEESYHAVGDLAETLALLHPAGTADDARSLADWMELIRNARALDETEKRDFIRCSWSALTERERFIFNKLISGTFRVGVSRGLTLRALGAALDVPVPTLSHRLMGEWAPAELRLSALSSDSETLRRSSPYPFYLAYQLDVETQELGDLGEWQAEYKWDGIRGQFCFRGGEIFIWSRGEELVTDQFPDLFPIAASLPPDTVLDGEIVAVRDDKILMFPPLQTRLNRKKLTAKILADFPVRFVAYDLLELQGADMRQLPLYERREKLELLVGQPAKTAPLQLSPVLTASTWEGLRSLQLDAREHAAEGLMLKRVSSPYEVGRKRGNWWKWKVDPLSVDAVLIYAQKGHGRRAGFYSDYTLAVWKDEGSLVPFAKAYSGLTDAEIAEVDRFIKSHTVERFGPVRTVTPELVFEIGFDTIQRSTRHRSGFAVRFPRILRWRKDKPASEASRLRELEDLFEAVRKHV